MNTCPNCGWANDPSSRFCENCGADLETLGARNQDSVDPWQRKEPADQSPGRQQQRPYWEISPSEDQWSMAPLPPEEMPKQRRKTWVWVLGVGFLLCVAVCVGSVFWLGYTDSGERFQTSVAENATEAADD